MGNRDPLLPLRDSLLEYSQAIEKGIRIDERRRGESAWRRRTYTELFDELAHTMNQLSGAIDRGGPGGIAVAATDVGTIALMLHDLARSRRGQRAEGTDGGEGNAAQGSSTSESGEAGARPDRGPSQDGA